MRLHLVDGTYELFRSHYSPRPGTVAPDGRDVKATVGLLMSLISLMTDRDEAATHLAVAFDNPVESFRNDLFDGYKTGDGIDPDLFAQFDLAERATAALGVAVWSMDQHEADDGMATGAFKFRDQVEQVRLMTPDKDLSQCIVGSKVVQVDRMRGKYIDEAKLLELKGIKPQSIPDYLALVGDTADGIPGIAGFGAKSTSAVLGRYAHLEAIPDDPAQWDVTVRGAKRLAGNLAGAREDALLYRKLATLVTDAPVSDSIEELEWKGARSSDWNALAEELGRADLRTRPPRFAS